MTTYLLIILFKNELGKTPNKNFNELTREIRYSIYTLHLVLSLKDQALPSIW